MKKEDIKQYAECVSTFCYFLGQLAKYSQQAKSGEVFSSLEKKKIVFAVDCVAKLKPLLLKRKQKLGFQDAFEFLEDNRFAGFQITNGIFTGSTTDLEKIIHPWVNGFPNIENHYAFEVANYLLYLSEPDIIDLYPERFKKEEIPSCQKIIRKRKYFPFNLLSSAQAVRARTS